MSYTFETLSVHIESGVATATISNTPVNVMTPVMWGDLDTLSQQIEQDDAVRVLVLKSADPEFFIAHFDVGAILERPVNTPFVPAERPKAYHVMCERYRTMPKVTIAQIEGRVGGGGGELAASMDMRFGVRGRTVLNQMEVALGILPGGTGTQRLPRLIGRGRALEVILGCDDLDAETAEAWGWLNRALDPDEIDSFVSALARRIASFPPQAVALAKQAVVAAEKPLAQGLVDEANLFNTLMRTPEAQRNMARFLEIGGQTREGEARMGALCAELGIDPKDS